MGGGWEDEAERGQMASMPAWCGASGCRVLALTRCCCGCCPQVHLSRVALYTDYKLDESYTPTRLSIRVGNSFADLREVGC